MTWAIITANESHCVDRPFEVAPRAAELLTANGWQPPHPRDPEGSFFMPEGAHMKLTRHQADLTVRQLTGRYHERYGVDNTERLDDFAAKLAWQTGGKNTKDFRDYLVDALIAFEGLASVYAGDLPLVHDDFESDLNCAVNRALDAAGINGLWIRYYAQAVAA